MIGYTRRHLTLMHIVRVGEVFMTKSSIQNGCNFEEEGCVSKGFLLVLKVFTFKMFKIIHI